MAADIVGVSSLSNDGKIGELLSAYEGNKDEIAVADQHVARYGDEIAKDWQYVTRGCRLVFHARNTTVRNGSDITTTGARHVDGHTAVECDDQGVGANTEENNSHSSVTKIRDTEGKQQCV